MNTAFVTSRTELGPLLDGVSGKWEVVIGMEVHAQVTSKAKLFSGASAEFGAEPNAHVSFVDAAMPGMLPVINRYCVEQAVKTGLGLKAKINKRSTFDRKNYFYPDLPAGYQISQYKEPIVGEGVVIVDMPGGKSFTVEIDGRLPIGRKVEREEVSESDSELAFDIVEGESIHSLMGKS